MIIHLNGWPGVGKKTIGMILAKQLSARFVHNHLLHDVAIVAAGFDSQERWFVYEQVRKAAYDALAKRPRQEIFVMTNALCKTAPREIEAWGHVVDLAIARNVPLLPIVLEVDEPENLRRVQSAERVGRKMTNAEELRSYFALDSIQYPDVPERFALDVTALSAEAAAAELYAHILKVAPGLQAATAQHLKFR